MKKRICAFFLAFVAAIGILPAKVIASEEYFPSVFVADTVWYKDKSLPLLQLESNSYYLPIDAYDALPTVSATLDETAGAFRLVSEKGVLSADLYNGTVISPEGDGHVRVSVERGAVYLNVFDVCSSLGLSFEIHTYANGSIAVRINDGSGILNVSSLVRMFAAKDSTLSRMSGPVSDTVYLTAVSVKDLEGLESALQKYKTTGNGFVLAIDAYFILQSSGTADFVSLMSEVYALDLPITLYVYEPSTDMMIDSLYRVNTRLIELFHKGTTFCTTTRALTESDRAVIESVGFMLTYYTIEEIK